MRRKPPHPKPHKPASRPTAEEATAYHEAGHVVAPPRTDGTAADVLRLPGVRRETAYHEAGHAVVGVALFGPGSIRHATVELPSDDSLGAVSLSDFWALPLGVRSLGRGKGMRVASLAALRRSGDRSGDERRTEPPRILRRLG